MINNKITNQKIPQAMAYNPASLPIPILTYGLDNNFLAWDKSVKTQLPLIYGLEGGIVHSLTYYSYKCQIMNHGPNLSEADATSMRAEYMKQAASQFGPGTIEKRYKIQTHILSTLDHNTMNFFICLANAEAKLKSIDPIWLYKSVIEISMQGADLPTIEEKNFAADETLRIIEHAGSEDLVQFYERMKALRGFRTLWRLD